MSLLVMQFVLCMSCLYHMFIVVHLITRAITVGSLDRLARHLRNDHLRVKRDLTVCSLHSYFSGHWTTQTLT